MKRAILIILSALIIAGCTIFAVAAMANEPDAVPPANDALAPGLITEDLDVEAAKEMIFVSNVTAAEKRLQITMQAIANEPLTYTPAAFYSIRSLKMIPVENTIYVGDVEKKIIVDTYHMDEETLKAISTEELLEYAFNITVCDILVGSVPNWNERIYENSKYKSNIYAELERRTDTAHYLLKKYLTTPVDGEYMRTRNIEILLMRKVYFEKLTDEELQIFVVKYAQNVLEREEKKVNFAFMNTLETYDDYVVERYNNACAAVGIRALATYGNSVGFPREDDALLTD